MALERRPPTLHIYIFYISVITMGVYLLFLFNKHRKELPRTTTHPPEPRCWRSEALLKGTTVTKKGADTAVPGDPSAPCPAAADRVSAHSSFHGNTCIRLRCKLFIFFKNEKLCHRDTPFTNSTEEFGQSSGRCKGSPNHYASSTVLAYYNGGMRSSACNLQTKLAPGATCLNDMVPTQTGINASDFFELLRFLSKIPPSDLNISLMGCFLFHCNGATEELMMSVL